MLAPAQPTRMQQAVIETGPFSWFIQDPIILRLRGGQSGSRQARMIWGSAAIFALPMGIIDGWYYTEAQKVVDARAKWDRALRMKPQTAASSDNSYDGGEPSSSSSKDMQDPWA
ncbi:hypothetical protein MGN70_013984 [Eutypa lata]|nr:hypothetical protein MGN70_013984 [Eutypa lata]